MPEHVGEQVHGQSEVRPRHLRPIDRDLAIGCGVEDAPYPFDRLGYLLRGGAPLSPLEEEVFEEVGDAGFFVLFVTRTSADVDVDGDRTGVRHAAREDPQSVVEHAPLKHGPSIT